MTNSIRRQTACRACASKKLIEVFSLDKSPLANSFLKKKDLGNKEYFFPLKLNFCENCGLVQLTHVVSPDLMFKHYLYVSSTSSVFVKHFKEFASNVYRDYKLKSSDLVIDIGSNDGILLAPFKKLGVKILGVDPAKNVVQIANKNGFTTICSYFEDKTAKKIVKNYKRAKIVSAANVFAHTHDWDKLVRSVLEVLTDDGIFIIEAPYLVDFIDKNLFDIIYHEHLSYIALQPLVRYFRKHKMKIIDAKRVDSHGGSIRIFVAKAESNYKIKASVAKLMELEIKKCLNKKATYIKFGQAVGRNKKELISILKKLKKSGKTIVGYGAPAKGNTLLNYFGIDGKLIDFIVDDNPLKQGLYTPGTHILIKNASALDLEQTDYILILAWNFAKSIMEKYAYVKKKGVNFIIPVPVPKIIS